MICGNCGAENQEDSLFCNKCGTDLSDAIDANIQEKKPKWYSKKKNVFLSIAVFIIAIIVISGIAFFNNPVSTFKSNINNNNYAEANKIYNEEIKGNTDRENSVLSYLKEEIADIQKGFLEGKVDFNSAKNRLETIKNTNLASNDVSGAMNEIKKINDSRIAFNKAEEFIKDKNFIDGIKEFSKVIEEDSNYGSAQKQIEQVKDSYKKDVLVRAEESATSKDYSDSVSLLKEASEIIPDDSEIIAKLSVYEKKFKEQEAAKRKQQVEKAKSEQLVIVESSKIVEQDARYKSLYPDMIQVIVKNLSDKTIKEMEVGSLGFDANGYPVKIKGAFDFSGGSYEKIGFAADVNIVAGGRFGDDVGWELDDPHGIKTVLSCVKSATFYDGTKWDNPYYKFWLEDHKEKPLK